MAMFTFDSVYASINGEERKYDVVRHPGGAAVLAIRNGCIALVEQYRPALGKKILEVPAGMRDDMEDPLLCARRELREETGLTAAKWFDMGSMLVSPGYTTEELFLFMAEDLHEGQQELDESEDIILHWVDLHEARRRVTDGELNDSKTAMLLQRYWLGMGKSVS